MELRGVVAIILAQAWGTVPRQKSEDEIVKLLCEQIGYE